MNTLSKKIIGSIITICGIGVAGFSGYLLLQGYNLVITLSLIGSVLFGITLVLSGLALISGERVRDILEVIFFSSH